MKLNKVTRLKLFFITLLQVVLVFVRYRVTVNDNIVLGYILFIICIISVMLQEIYFSKLYLK